MEVSETGAENKPHQLGFLCGTEILFPWNSWIKGKTRLVNSSEQNEEATSTQENYLSDF